MDGLDRPMTAQRQLFALESGQIANTFPSKVIRIPVDKEAVLRNGIVAQKDSTLIVRKYSYTLKGDILYKNRMMMLDIIANNNWERPIYFSGGSFGDDDYLWMKDYLQLEGLCINWCQSEPRSMSAIRSIWGASIRIRCTIS